MHDREAADRLEREPTAPDRPPDGRQSAQPSAASVLALQRAAGNRAVQRLVRGGPGTDPKFAALKRDVAGKQRRLSAHPPPRTEAAAAQGAAKPPADDKLAQGKVAQAGEMDAAKPGGFDKAAFIRAVNDAIAAQAPKNLDEADKFAESGRADQVKGQVQGKVTEGKKVSAGQIESTTKAAPDTSRAVQKPVTPLSPDQPPPAPGGPDPAQAVPDRAPPEATDFSAGPRQVNSQMDQAQVSEEQLARSNEPEFTDALKAKKDGEKHAAAAPPQLRASESQTLTAGKQHAAAAGTTAMTSMALHRRTAGAQVHAGKQSTQSGDEARRAAATAKLQAVFDATRTEVEGILSGLDRKVDEQFTSLEGEARRAFTAEHKAKMDAYKHKRYSGWTGKLRWVKDKFTGLPEEANQIFTQARAGYTARMRQVIATIADTIATELTRAKARIAKGKADLAVEVNKLPADLKAMGQQAAAGFTDKFDELTDQVNSKGTDLVQTLASRYTEALKSVDTEIEAEKEKNKGLIAKAMDAVKGVIDTILKLKDLLLGILAKAASAVMAIIKDPIGFLGNLVHAVGAGLRDFIANIGEHLKKGLVSWLLGAAAQAGLQIPAKFDLKGILSLIGGLLGLTWSAIRGRVVSRGVPDQAVAAAEKAVPEADALQKEGLPGLWQRIQAKVGSLKDMIMGKLAAFLIPTVLIAGITWLVSLLTPASAFVKACKAIIDIVTFIVERGAQLAAFVNAVLDAVIAIAGGGAGSVPGLIVNALAASIPVLIGFLAALLGVGGIADKVKKVFQAVAKPVMKVVDWVVDKIVKLAKKFWAKLRNKFGRNKDGRNAKDPEKLPVAEKARIAKQASQAAHQRLTSAGVRPAQAPAVLAEVLGQWREKGVKDLKLVRTGGHLFAVEATVNPTEKTGPVAVIVDQQTMLTFNQAMSLPERADQDPRDVPTFARGLFVYNEKATEYGPAQSSEKRGPQRDVEVAKGSHAEEMVIAKFRAIWDQRPAGVKYAVTLELDVAASCCLNCAQYVASFVRDLEAAGCTVTAKAHFGRAYQGGMKARPTVVPESATQQAAFRRLRENAMLSPSAAAARPWGRPADAPTTTEPAYSVERGKEQAMAGLAILRNAGVAVSALGVDRMDAATTTSLSERQKEIMKARGEQLEEWLAEAERELVTRK